MLDSIKKNPIVRLAYRVPGLIWTYHFLWALLSAVLYWFPSRKMVVVGVTGTKGKTSVAEILAAIFRTAGKKTALLSSVKIQIGGEYAKNRLGNSMPGRGYIQKFLRNAAKQGCTHAVIEVTSEGTVRSRHRFVNFAAGIITNLAPEHIESHGSFEKYRDAKLAFLAHVADGGAPVLVNKEDERSGYYFQKIPGAIGYGVGDLPAGLSRIFEVLPGEFSRQNIAAAARAARELNINEEDIIKALENFEGISGRVEFVQKEPFKVVVDYAHTPESLEAIFGTMREMTPGKLICVFGATGGGRDKWKRPVMGEKAAMYCDEIILTDDDPYEEDSKAIINEIKKGIGDIKPVREIVNRKLAIREAIKTAGPGDTIVLAGKGTEPFLHLAGGQKIEWNDKEVAEQELRSRA